MKVLIAGDYCPIYKVGELLGQKKYLDVMGEMTPYILSSDFSILNLECPLLEKKEEPIEKKGPNLFAFKDAAEAIKNIGFKAVSLANNHFRDYGDAGCKSTIGVLDKLSILHVGGGKNLTDANKVLYYSCNGETLAIINVCEHEFNIATDDIQGSAPIDLINVYSAIRDAKKKADFILVITHSGHEHFNLPSLTMKRNYRWFVEIGADAVVNHHQHCYSGYEIYKGKPIVYGLGNFCFPRPGFKNTPWNEGYVVKLETGGLKQIEIIPYRQCNEDNKVTLVEGDDKKVFLEKVDALSSIIIDEISHKRAISEYYESCKKDIEIVLGNYSDKKIIRGLKRRNIISSGISKEKILLLYDYIMCESHRDKIIYYLKSKLVL